MLSIKKIVAGYLQTNSYLIMSQTDKSAVLVDAGGGIDKIDKYLSQNGVKLVALLLTHGHFDHVTIANKLKEKYDAKVHIHQADEIMLSSKDNLACMAGINVEPCVADVVVAGGETLDFGTMKFSVIHTPGHSKGSVTYVLNDKYMFCGDTLFRDSYGATHFPGGDMAEIKKSIDYLFGLDGDYSVFCGHGEDTTLQYERLHNPINHA